MYFLEGTFKKAIFSILTWCMLVRNLTLILSCLCNALFTGLQHKVGIPNFVSGPREYIMEGEYVILAMCSWFRIR